MKIATVVGARPQFVKAAIVSQAIAHNPKFLETIIHTGQHYDSKLSEIFFEELSIPAPNYSLEIGSASHGAQTGRMIESLENVYLTESPDLVLVYGDTNSTLAAAIAAIKLEIPVAHVEAGLRSFNKEMPEEWNRILTDHSSALLFAPTQTAAEQLRKEGLPDEKIHVVGDVMYDAAIFYLELAKSKSTILKNLGLEKHDFAIATVHRASNTDNITILTNIALGLLEIGKELPVVFPMHPRTAKALARCGLCEKVKDGLTCIEPVGYLDMLMLENEASLVLTDSGGVQKEAFFSQTPCITLRRETEWTELVELGWNRLVTPEELPKLPIIARQTLGQKGVDGYPYGYGDACARIAKVLAQYNGPQKLDSHLSQK